MHLVTAQPGAVESVAVERDRLHVLGRAVGARLDESRGLDAQVALAEPDLGLGERRRVDEEEVLAGHREQPERRPDVPGAEPARVVVARQPAATGAELLVHGGVHHLGGAVGPAGVLVGPRRLHVGLVVEALEAAERVARSRAPRCPGERRAGAPAAAPKPKNASSMRTKRVVAPGEPDPVAHVVEQPERVVVPAALVERRVEQQARGVVERVHPARGERS